MGLSPATTSSNRPAGTFNSMKACRSWFFPVATPAPPTYPPTRVASCLNSATAVSSESTSMDAVAVRMTMFETSAAETEGSESAVPVTTTSLSATGDGFPLAS